MPRDTLDVVRVYSGPPDQVETFRFALAGAGIEAHVAGCGALPSASEDLLVHCADLPAAVAVIRREAARAPRAEPDAAGLNPA